jgi:uncharacterized membrane protein
MILMRTPQPLPTSPDKSPVVRYGLLWICLLVGAYTVIFFLLQKRLYDGLHMELWDLGMFNQALHNTLHGRVLQYSVLGGSGHLFYNSHAQPIVLLLTPLYAILPGVDLLFFVQAFSIAMGSLAIYLIAVLLSADDILAAGLGTAYLLYPSIQGMTLNMFLYGFHPENLAATFVLFAVYCFLRNRMWWVYLLATLAMMCGEYVALTIAAFGVYIMLAHREKWKTGEILLVVSLVWLFLSMLVVIPLFRGSIPWYLARLLGTQTRASTGTPISLPVPLVPLYIKYLLLPLLFTPLLSLPSLLLAVPGTILNFLAYSFGYRGYSPLSWHMANVAPFVFLSGTLGLSSLYHRLKTRGKSQALIYVLLSLILIANILASFWLSPMPWSHAVERDQYAELTPTRAAVLEQLHSLIGPDSLSADIFWSSQFTSREIIHLFPYGGWRDHDWVLVDTQSEFMNPWIRENIDLVRNSPDHRLRLREDGVELFQFTPRELPMIDVQMPVTFSNHVRLLGYNLSPTLVKTGEDITLDLFWIADDFVDNSYTVFVHVVSPEGQTVAQTDNIPVNGSYPMNRWPIGETMWDTHHLQLNDGVEAGRYEIWAGLYYWEDGKRVEIVEGDGDRANSVVPLGSVTVGADGQGSSDDS